MTTHTLEFAHQYGQRCHNRGGAGEVSGLKSTIRVHYRKMKGNPMPTQQQYQATADRVAIDPGSTTGYHNLGFKVGRGENSRLYPLHETAPICLECYLPECYRDNDIKRGRPNCPINMMVAYGLTFKQTLNLTRHGLKYGLSAAECHAMADRISK